MVEAQSVLAAGYKGIREDISIVMGWPVSRVASIAKGRVLSGLRYGSKNAQAQAVIVIGKRLIEEHKAGNVHEVVVSMSVAHWHRLSSEVRAKITLENEQSNGQYHFRVRDHVVKVLPMAPEVDFE